MPTPDDPSSLTPSQAAASPSVISVEVSKDRVSASLCLGEKLTDEQLHETFFLAALQERAIVIPGDIRATIDSIRTDYLAGGRAPLQRPAAQGLAPVHGIHARIEIEPGLLRDNPRSQSNATIQPPADSQTGTVDHRARAAFVSVKAGQVIGRIIPEVPGEDGVDVFGRSIACKAALPISLTLDDSIIRRADGSLVATRGGLLERTRDSYRVATTLKVTGDVDYSTGHIDFPGTVIIEGEIRDQFTVTAGLDIIVKSSADAATLDCGGSLTLERGMAAREMGTLRVGKDLSARYLTNITAVIGRDATIESELHACSLTIGRDFIAPRASIVRGELCVSRRCEVRELGTEANVETRITLGRVPLLDKLARYADELQPLIANRLNHAETKLNEIKHFPRPPRDIAERITELQYNVQNDRALLAKLRLGVSTILQAARARSTVDLTVHHGLHRGVKIWLGVFLAEINQSVKGPLRITLADSCSPSITYLSTNTTHRLSSIARVTTDSRLPDLTAIAARHGVSEPGPSGALSDSSLAA